MTLASKRIIRTFVIVRTISILLPLPIQAIEEEARAGKEKEKELVGGNPLLGLAGDVTFNLKRRWGRMTRICMYGVENE
jgi:hypothetical protein